MHGVLRVNLQMYTIHTTMSIWKFKSDLLYIHVVFVLRAQLQVRLGSSTLAKYTPRCTTTPETHPETDASFLSFYLRRGAKHAPKHTPERHPKQTGKTYPDKENFPDREGLSKTHPIYIGKYTDVSLLDRSHGITLLLLCAGL